MIQYTAYVILTTRLYALCHVWLFSFYYCFCWRYLFCLSQPWLTDTSDLSMDTTQSPRTLRSATSPWSPGASTLKSPPISERSITVSERSRASLNAKGKSPKRKIHVLEDDDEDTANENSDVEEEKSNNKRSKTESTSDIEANKEERKFVKMKVCSGDTISSPCWSSKLCQIATLTKEVIVFVIANCDF